MGNTDTWLAFPTELWSGNCVYNCVVVCVYNIVTNVSVYGYKWDERLIRFFSDDYSTEDRTVFFCKYIYIYIRDLFAKTKALTYF